MVPLPLVFGAPCKVPKRGLNQRDLTRSPFRRQNKLFFLLYKKKWGAEKKIYIYIYIERAAELMKEGGRSFRQAVQVRRLKDRILHYLSYGALQGTQRYWPVLSANYLITY